MFADKGTEMGAMFSTLSTLIAAGGSRSILSSITFSPLKQGIQVFPVDRFSESTIIE